ncbi:hypothetical protein T492DRAFT_1145476 [Pavlovales sp. CCMP2436]|nr:hypothetical protein T492DRAFT_1145476 [Pavlovales sp. CCMP2436]
MAEDGAGPSSAVGPSFAAYNTSAPPGAARGAGRGRGGRGGRAGGRGLAGGRGRGRAVGRGGGDGDGGADYNTLEGFRVKSMKLTPVMHELWAVLGREPPPPPLPPPPKPALAAPPAVVVGAQALPMRAKLQPAQLLLAPVRAQLLPGGPVRAPPFSLGQPQERPVRPPPIIRPATAHEYIGCATTLFYLFIMTTTLNQPTGPD